jgi:hypothetical protein
MPGDEINAITKNHLPMSKEKNVKVINDLVATIMKLGVGFAEGQVGKRVNDPLVEKGVDLIFPLTRKMIEVLSDNNPDNTGQVKEVMLDWTNGPLANYLEEIFAALIVKQKDENVKALLAFLTLKFVEALRIYSDDDEKNKEQINALWEGIIVAPQTHALIVDHIVKPLLIKSGATEQWVVFVTNLVQTTLEGLVGAKNGGTVNPPAIQ